MEYKLPKGSLISYMSSLVKEHGGINLAQGLPGYEPPTELIEYLNKNSYASIHQYPPGIGNYKLLDLLVQYYSQYLNVDRDNFLITCGATEAISLLYLFVKRECGLPFSVMTFSPAYESYTQIANQLDDYFYTIPLNEDGSFDEYQLQDLISWYKVRLFFVGSPGNPWGKIIPKEHIERLLEICDKYDVYVVFDAVYKELYFNEPPYIPFEHLSDRLFYVNSFSKLLNITGWRVGYLMGTKEQVEQIRRIHDYTGLCAPSLLQVAIAEYLEKHNMGLDNAATMRKNIKHTFDLMSNALTNLGFAIPATDGGYFIWAKLPEGYDDGFQVSVDLYNQTKVATVAGIHFSREAKDYIRINVARPENEILQSISLINDYFKNQINNFNQPSEINQSNEINENNENNQPNETNENQLS